MFKLSKKGEYALRTVFHLSFYNNTCITEDIANAQQIPKAFLKKIIQSLRTAGLVSSTKGKSGGVMLNVSPDELSVKEVIEKIEGPLYLNDCLVSKGACKRSMICPLHEMWVKCQESVLQVLSSYKFSDLVKRYKDLIEKNKDNIKEGLLVPNQVPVLDTSSVTG